MLLLSDVILYVYDEKVATEAFELANLGGATTFYKLIPFLTTHIIAQEETPELRQIIAQL